MSIFKFDLGDQVKDQVSGYIGVITGRTQWLNGCVRYILEAQKLEGGKPVDPLNVDEQQLVLMKALKVNVGQVTNAVRAALSEPKSLPKPPGGPRPAPSRSRVTPTRSRSIRR